jgi:hypothetical protein
MEHDPSFNSPFEHRIVELKEGSIFKTKYEIYEELGRGRFGVVFKVKDKENGEILVSSIWHYVILSEDVSSTDVVSTYVLPTDILSAHILSTVILPAEISATDVLS